MPNIYLTENLFNRDLGITPRRYIGSDQFDRPEYFGSSEDLKSDLNRLGPCHFVKHVLEYIPNIENRDLREIC